MTFVNPVTFLRRAMLIAALITIILTFCFPLAWGASAPTKITVHTPGKSLGVMVFFFGKDKGFFLEEGIEAQLVVMSPPIAIAAMVAGELDFLDNSGSGNFSHHAGIFA
jgi:ABC-type nitrate/sulfonate/bicarbonate transport system substrate-binding protein